MTLAEPKALDSRIGGGVPVYAEPKIPRGMAYVFADCIVIRGLDDEVAHVEQLPFSLREKWQE